MSNLNQATNEGIVFQDKIGGIFKKYDLGVKVLDKGNNRRRPDFFVFLKDNNKKGFICECKSIVSAGVTKKGQHISMQMPDELKEGEIVSFDIPKKFRENKIEEVIKDALSQYQTLITDKPSYQKFPFVIALEFDFFVDSSDDHIFNHIFNLIKKNIPEKEIQEISAVMKIEKNIEQKRGFKESSTNDLEEMIIGKRKKEISPESVKFKVLLNSKARIKFKPEDFLKNRIVLHSKEENL